MGFTGPVAPWGVTGRCVSGGVKDEEEALQPGGAGAAACPSWVLGLNRVVSPCPSAVVSSVPPGNPGSLYRGPGWGSTWSLQTLAHWGRSGAEAQEHARLLGLHVAYGCAACGLVAHRRKICVSGFFQNMTADPDLQGPHPFLASGSPLLPNLRLSHTSLFYT